MNGTVNGTANNGTEYIVWGQIERYDHEGSTGVDVTLPIDIGRYDSHEAAASHLSAAGVACSLLAFADRAARMKTESERDAEDAEGSIDTLRSLIREARAITAAPEACTTTQQGDDPGQDEAKDIKHWFETEDFHESDAGGGFSALLTDAVDGGDIEIFVTRKDDQTPPQRWSEAVYVVVNVNGHAVFVTESDTVNQFQSSLDTIIRAAIEWGE